MVGRYVRRYGADVYKSAAQYALDYSERAVRSSLLEVSDNDLQVVYLGTALSKLGAVKAPVNPALATSLRHVLTDAAPTALTLSGDDTLISILPLFHGGGRHMNVGACLLAGARCGFVRRFSGKEFFAQAREFGATVMHGVLNVGHFLLAQEPSERDRDHTITRGLIAPCPESVAASFAERSG